jgi:hypothetical protein
MAWLSPGMAVVGYEARMLLRHDVVEWSLRPTALLVIPYVVASILILFGRWKAGLIVGVPPVVIFLGFVAVRWISYS